MQNLANIPNVGPKCSNLLRDKLIIYLIVFLGCGYRQEKMAAFAADVTTGKLTIPK